MKPILLTLATSLFFCARMFAAQSSKPNILVILADDLGYGDVRCNNPDRGKIPTPNIDQLASQGTTAGRSTPGATFGITSAKDLNPKDSFKVLRDKGKIAVELPYQASASMVLIMPEKTDGMKALEDSLNQATIPTLCKNLQGAKDENADLFLPKFKLATSYDLVEPMKQLGMVDAFDGKADFKVMYGETPVKISKIKHMATLEVDEMGSVASAATAVEFQLYRGRVSAPPQIRFDRPFFVLIRENTTGTNLFMGRINDPTAK